MRFVYSVIKINTELERVGDYAKAIARRFLTVSDLGTQASYPKLINIANLAIPFLRNALQAFTERDAELAKATREREKERTIDNMRYEIHSDLIQLHINGELPSEALVPLVTIVGCLERVANQASNICEEVLYMCTGEDLRHDYHQVLRVLCVAEHDACRGQMAVGIGNGLEPKRILFSSAGVASQPLDPKTVEFMAEKGIDISAQTSKYLSQILDLKDYAIIVSLCEEAERGLPSLPSRPVRINWKVQDPSRIEGTEEEIHAAYQKTFQFLDTHLRELVQAILGDDVRRRRKQMFNKVLCAIVVVAFCLFSSGCSKKDEVNEKNKADKAEKSVIQNAGSDTMVNLAQAWAEEYATVEPNVSIEVSGGGSGTGIAALTSGTVDIANCSRQMTLEEIERVKQNTGEAPKEFVVGHDALAVYVHKDNPLAEISLDQLANIYGEGGDITKWSQLGIENSKCVNDEDYSGEPAIEFWDIRLFPRGHSWETIKTIS